MNEEDCLNSFLMERDSNKPQGLDAQDLSNHFMNTSQIPPTALKSYDSTGDASSRISHRVLNKTISQILQAENIENEFPAEFLQAAGAQDAARDKKAKPSVGDIAELKALHADIIKIDEKVADYTKKNEILLGNEKMVREQLSNLEQHIMSI